MRKKNYYEILRVSRNATQKEIRHAYRKLARQYHPDLNPGDKQSIEKFKQVQEAYDVLSDVDKRREFDRSSRETEESRTSDQPSTPTRDVNSSAEDVELQHHHSDVDSELNPSSGWNRSDPARALSSRDVLIICSVAAVLVLVLVLYQRYHG